MASDKNDSPPDNGYSEVYLRYVGKFIFWTVLSLVGWSFYTTLQNDKAIALLEQRVTALERLVK